MSGQNYTKRIMFSIGSMIGMSVCLSVPALAFITVDRYHSDCNSILDMNVLMHRIHDAHWEINYGFSEACDHDYHADPRQLVKFENAMETALRVCLQPLREIETKHPIVDSFSFKLTELDTWEELTPGRVELVDIKFDCASGFFISYARLKKDKRTGVVIGGITTKDSITYDQRMRSLVHELGHALGLGDTYVHAVGAFKSSGGLKSTIGIQPASAMSAEYNRHPGKYLTEDDKRGIVWLYKVFYDDLPLTAPYFSDYTFEEATGGFRPTYPLLFELKHGFQGHVFEIIRDDPNMDVNVRDESGRTALDYTVIEGYLNVLFALLSRPDLKVNAQNDEGSTALHLAVSNDDTAAVELLLRHKGINVNATDKQGRTPLHLAAETAALASVKALLRHTQVRRSTQDNRGFTALDYAAKYSAAHNDSRVFHALLNPVDDPDTDTVRAPPPEGMVLIPAGTFLMGSHTPDSESGERSVWMVYVDAFYMDKTEVTNAQFKEFLIENPCWQKGGIHAKRLANPGYLELWTGNNFPSGKGNHPVTHVSWYAAMAYSNWAGKRLPTEAEWARAAQAGLSYERYPWEDTITPQDANYGHNVNDTTAVGRYPANGYGLYDMVGNVSEWCLDRYDYYLSFPLPRNRVARNPMSGGHSMVWLMYKFTRVKSARVVRGGSWNDSAEALVIYCEFGVPKLGSYRDLGSPSGVSYDLGFRCVKDILTR